MGKLKKRLNIICSRTLDIEIDLNRLVALGDDHTHTHTFFSKTRFWIEKEI